MISFKAAEDVLKFFDQKGIEAKGSIREDEIVTDMIREQGVTLPWVEDGLAALTDMAFVVPIGGNEEKADKWKLTTAGYRAMRGFRKCAP